MSARLSLTPCERREPAPAVPRTSAALIVSTWSIGWWASSTTSAVISFVMEAIGAGVCSLRAASTEDFDWSRT
jgi:hypothetical protein